MIRVRRAEIWAVVRAKGSVDAEDAVDLSVICRASFWLLLVRLRCILVATD